MPPAGFPGGDSQSCRVTGSAAVPTVLASHYNPVPVMAATSAGALTSWKGAAIRVAGGVRAKDPARRAEPEEQTGSLRRALFPPPEGRGVDRAVQHAQWVPPVKVLQDEVSTGSNCCQVTSQESKNDREPGDSSCTESASHQRLPSRMDFLLPTRVIELYNNRSGMARSGAYRVQGGTEDGFAPGP
jgi:hypothetical protein